MRSWRELSLGRWAAFSLAAISVTTSLAATTPSSGTLSPTNPVLTFTGGPYALSNPVDSVGGTPPACTDATCGIFTMTVAIPDVDFNSYRVGLVVGWTNSGTTTLGSSKSDFDVYVYQPDETGTQSAKSNTNSNPEDTSFDVSNGIYTIYVEPYDVSPDVTFNATARLIPVTQTSWPPTPGATRVPPGTPRFFNYAAPRGVAEYAGEPSIGVNWRSEKVFAGVRNGGTVNYFGGFLPYMLSVDFDDRTSPATATWSQRSVFLPTLPRVYSDPILFTDSQTGRTFVEQELGLTPLGSTMEFTDNDGVSFMSSEGSGAPSGIDHPTVGGGPFHEPIPAGVDPEYPRSVWYCSNNVLLDAVCSISLDGGRTFEPAVPIYTAEDCAGTHGHIKIGPDGTAYVPVRACGGNPPFHLDDGARQAVLVSENNGVTWDVRPVPTATITPLRDPSVAVASDGTLYFAYQAADGHSRVAVSHDKGKTWINDTDIGAQVGVQNSLFQAAVAGDPDRATVAFFGTETGGSGFDQPGFPGVWSLYISTTFDGGRTWTTQDITPGDPIQRGGICGSGSCRNLLDFIDATIDKEGRVLVGYDDGCISDGCVSGERSYGLTALNDFTAKAVIARQASGKRMFAAYDVPARGHVNPRPPPPPPPHATSCDGKVATDPADDAIHPLLGPLGGTLDQADITGLDLALSADKQSMSTTIRLKNLSPLPVRGSLGTYYFAVWTAARKNNDGGIAARTYATRAAVDASGGSTYEFGRFDPATNQFVGTPVAATGSSLPGPDGSVSVNVPLSLLGNPTIPVTDSTMLPAVIEPYALSIVHEQAVYFSQPADRAPDAGAFGANWAVCPA